MKIRTAALCAIVSLSSGCAWFGFGKSPEDSFQASVTSTDQAVQQFLAGRDLDPVEGAWEHEGSAFELVISRNDFEIAPDYDYVGIMTRSDRPMWDEGQVKLMLQRTDSPDVFEGVWMTHNKSKQYMTFVIKNKNLIQASFRTNDGESFFVRIRRINPRLARTY